MKLKEIAGRTINTDFIVEVKTIDKVKEYRQENTPAGMITVEIENPEWIFTISLVGEDPIIFKGSKEELAAKRHEIIRQLT